MDDVVNFDAIDPSDADALRKALIDQMAYLVEEVEALKTVVETVPESVQSGRPTPNDLTMKEIYGVLATLDRDVRPGQIRQVASGNTPSLATPDPDALVRDQGWNARDIAAILDAVQDARRTLVDRLRDLPADAWSAPATYDGDAVTLAALLHRYAKADMERLRTLGYRLHDADLS